MFANFTVTPERKQVIDFAKPYMKVSIGVVSRKSAPITKVSQLKGKKMIVNKGTTAESYFTTKQKGVDLLKFDSKTQQFNALKNDRGVALADFIPLCMGQEPSKVYGRHQDAWTEPVYCPRDQERQ